MFFLRLVTVEEYPHESDFSFSLDKFAGMLSNFMETTKIRINGVYPDKEIAVAPLLSGRLIEGKEVIQKGEIFVPELLYSPVTDLELRARAVFLVEK
jgi:putative ABC transport system permease protein